MKTLLAILIALSSSYAHAWGARGHEMVGHIAQDELSPRARKVLESLFGRDFSLATESTWADRIKSNKAFDRFKPWHYADQPALKIEDVLGKKFPKPEDQKPEEKAAIPFIESLLKDQPYLLANHAPAGDALQALFFLEGVVKSPRSTKEQKIFALRYIIHITGDIHMPLHVGSGLDQGGNACLVKWKGKEEKTYPPSQGGATIPMNLHAAWDDEFPDARLCGDKSCESRDYATLLQREYQQTLKENKRRWSQGTSLDWAKESGDFRESVYPVMKDETGKPIEIEGKIPGRPYCRKGNEVIPSELKPEMSEDYYTTWKKTMETRILQGGVRLAARLNALLK